MTYQRIIQAAHAVATAELKRAVDGESRRKEKWTVIGTMVSEIEQKIVQEQTLRQDQLQHPSKYFGQARNTNTNQNIKRLLKEKEQLLAPVCYERERAQCEEANTVWTRFLQQLDALNPYEVSGVYNERSESPVKILIASWPTTPCRICDSVDTCYCDRRSCLVDLLERAGYWCLDIHSYSVCVLCNRAVANIPELFGSWYLEVAGIHITYGHLTDQGFCCHHCENPYRLCDGCLHPCGDEAPENFCWKCIERINHEVGLWIRRVEANRLPRKILDNLSKKPKHPGELRLAQLTITIATHYVKLRRKIERQINV